MSIIASDWIAFHADRTPEKLALIDQHTGRQFTYGELNDRAARLAGFLQSEWGARKGDRIAILAKNAAEYFEFQWACMKLGALMLPLNWRLAIPELKFILEDASPIGLVYDAEFSDRIPDLRPHLRHTLRMDFGQLPPDDAPAYEDAVTSSALRVHMGTQFTHDDPMMIMYTAGTTGHPKGVLITYGMMLWNAINISTPTGLNQNSVFYCVLPTFHIGGLNLYVNPLLHLGGTSVIARQFDAELAIQTLSDPQLGVTHMFGVPSIYLFISQHPDFEAADFSRVQSWGCGGAPMPVAVLEKYAKRGIVIQLGFGMTETSPTVFLIDKRRALEKPTSVGKPLQHTRVRVVREDFSDVNPGEVGEVVISGPNITPGYWQRPHANNDSFTTDNAGARWLHSGDAGTVDDEGCIYIVDRYKDMYISGGENVYPAEIEQVLYQVEGVVEAAVIGVPDERWGESGLAILVLKEGYMVQSADIIAYCQQHVARFKVPKAVVVIDSLPRNAAGKVLKRELKARFITL